ncbi:MAG: hypothetical protein JSS68_15065 [Actinobacteria bacterium]|nr:hypothetical protein [Actinomycetota bacterium]
MRPAAKRPPYCSGCFQHKSGRFIDFEVAYDGPVIPGSPANIPIDDLILCEDCVRRSAELLDLHGEQATIAELQQIVLDQQAEIEGKDKMLTGALATIEELQDFPVKRPAGKPALVGVSDDVREQITRARYERNGTSPVPKKVKAT